MKKMSLFSFIISILGGFGIGVNIILSEILYSDIDDFFKTPTWYQAFMCISIIIAMIGFILSYFFRNKFNTNKKEKNVEIVLLIVGLILMLGCALIKIKSYALDILICVGGMIFFVGLSGFVSTLIGLNRKIKINFDFDNKSIDEIFKIVENKNITKNDINSFVISLYSHLLEKSQYYSFDYLNKLSNEEKTVLIYKVFIEEVENGGFCQFLDNSSSIFLSELKDTLNNIKAFKVLDIYSNLLDKLQNDNDEIDALILRYENEMNEADKSFYNSINDFYSDIIIYNYVINNKEKFN